jgi:primosomal protein N' (replication factor Y)
VPGIVWGAQEDGPTPQERLREVAEVMDSLPPLPPAWRALVDFAAAYYQRGTGELALSVLPPELRKLTGVQVAKRVARLLKSPPAAPGGPPPVWPDLTAEQSAALEGLRDTGPVLLHGVTGSGKTEVYLRAADRALQAGRQVLVLVPEINLTPQLEARFAQRFPGRVLVSLHSGLTPAQRLKHWLMAHLGLADLVLGTRLAVFTPLPRPGLIVVDEEHDPSFKQQEGARYSARDLAVYRGRLDQVPVVLGSATPSLESWQRSLEGRYRRLSMPTRIGGGVMPEVRLLDMSQLPRERGENAPALAAPLLRAIAALRRLQLEEPVPALQRLARVPQARPHAALPPLRLHRARAARLPGLRQPGHRARGPRYREARGADGRPAARGAGGAHRRRHHAHQGLAGRTTRCRARRRCRRAGGHADGGQGA